MNLQERCDHIIEWFKVNRPVAETELHFENPYDLLVAVILSAQCTDKRVNLITPSLLQRFPTPHSMAKSDQSEIFEFIRTCSYPNNKAKSLLGMAQKLVSDFGGSVPETIEDLITIPGVGRKTANVILSVVFDKPAMAVDTHVFRVGDRLGLSKGSNSPLDTERRLVKLIPENLLSIAHHWLILHGRYVCLARKPKCEECGLTAYCLFFESRKDFTFSV